MALNTEALPFFVFAAAVLLVTPGPDTAFITATGITRGKTPAFFGALGVSLSMFSHSVFAAAGLSAIFAASCAAFEAVRYTGFAYLVWLAYSSVRATGAHKGASEVRMSPEESLKQGFLTNLLNPKVILFISLFLVQFASPGHGPFFLQILSLGAVLGVMAFAFFAALGYLSGSVGKALLRNEPLRSILTKASGVVFLGLALNLLFLKRPTWN